MPLVKCPDCEKMVSERVSNCPFCGCPAEYFLKDVETKKENDNKKNTSVEMDSKNKETIKFKIADFTINYPSGSQEFASLFGSYLHAADIAYEEMCKLYDGAKGIGKALEILPDKANELIYGVIEQGTKFFYLQGINITPEQFIEKYAHRYIMEYGRYYDVTLEKYSEILDMKRELDAYRNSIKANRGRWQGGGFGVTGAIKGAITASVLNLGSDFLHSFGDSARAKEDNQAVQSKLRALYRESKGQLCHSVKTCMMNVFDAMCEELEDIKYFDIMLRIDRKEANAIYENATKYETEPSGFCKKMIECILLYPGDRRYYEPFKDDCLNGDSQIKDFLAFWNLEYILEDWINEREIKERFNQYAINQNIVHFDFDDQTAENAVLLWELLEQWKGDIPNTGEWAEKVQSYLKKFRSNTNENTRDVLIDYLPSNFKMREFLNKCMANQKWLNICPLPRLYFTEPTEQVRRVLEKEQGVIQLYFDISMMENGSKGLAITNRYVVDLKTKEEIAVEQVKEIFVEKTNNDRYSIKITDGTKTIAYKQIDIGESECAAYYLRNVLKAYLIRFGNNKYLGELDIQDMETETVSVNAEGAERYFGLVSAEYSKDELTGKLKWRNEFRRRFKYIACLLIRCHEEIEQNFIYRYDYEIQNEDVLRTLGTISGQYVLFASPLITVTDQFLYTQDKRFELDMINDIVLFEDLAEGDNWFLHILHGNKADNIGFEVEAKYQMDWFTELVYSIDIALETLNTTKHLYESDKLYYCVKCGSLDVKQKLFGVQCKNCNNSKFDTLAQIKTIGADIISFFRKQLGGEELSTEEERELLKDEDTHIAWIENR